MESNPNHNPPQIRVSVGLRLNLGWVRVGVRLKMLLGLGLRLVGVRIESALGASVGLMLKLGLGLN